MRYFVQPRKDGYAFTAHDDSFTGEPDEGYFEVDVRPDVGDTVEYDAKTKTCKVVRAAKQEKAPEPVDPAKMFAKAIKALSQGKPLPDDVLEFVNDVDP